MTDIIMDTNAIYQMIKKEIYGKVLNKFAEKPYNLIIPDPPFSSEIKGLHLSPSFYSEELPTIELKKKGKFLKRKCNNKTLFDEFRKAGLKKNDANIACVAVERARKSPQKSKNKVKAILVSDDPDFEEYDVLNLLKKEGVYLKKSEEFYKFISDC